MRWPWQIWWEARCSCSGGEQWTAELKVLSELVEHHVNEEESTGFSCARDEFDKDELETMGQRFQTRKGQMMTRVA